MIARDCLQWRVRAGFAPASHYREADPGYVEWKNVSTDGVDDTEKAFDLEGMQWSSSGVLGES